MTKQILLLGLVCGLLGLSTGCEIMCWPYNCGSGLSGPGCGAPCGPVAEQDCTAGCGPGCGMGGRPCGMARDCGCEPCAPAPGPLSCLFRIFAHNSWCGRSCGERYWGDFYSDPPDIWDPCDCSGNYTGRECQTGPGGAYADPFTDPFGDLAEAQPPAGQPVVERQTPTLARRSPPARPTGAGNGNRIVASRKVSETDRVVTPAERPAQPRAAVRPQ